MCMNLKSNEHNISNHRSGGRLQIVGAHLEPEEPEDQALHLGIFKPKAGVREKLRETLHTVLEHEMVERQKEKELEDLEQSTTPPISTVTISANTRVEEAKQRGDEVRASAGRRRLAGNRLRAKAKQRGSSRFVSKLRGRTRGKVQRTEDVENQREGEGEEETKEFQPTVPTQDQSPSFAPTQRPFIPTKQQTKAQSSTSTTETIIITTTKATTTPEKVTTTTQFIPSPRPVTTLATTTTTTSASSRRPFIRQRPA